ncbi:MAG: PAS domain S-box protein [Chitinophagaceae bacterium]
MNDFTIDKKIINHQAFAAKNVLLKNCLQLICFHNNWPKVTLQVTNNAKIALELTETNIIQPKKNTFKKQNSQEIKQKEHQLYIPLKCANNAAQPLTAHIVVYCNDKSRYQKNYPPNKLLLQQLSVVIADLINEASFLKQKEDALIKTVFQINKIGYFGYHPTMHPSCCKPTVEFYKITEFKKDAPISFFNLIQLIEKSKRAHFFRTVKSALQKQQKFIGDVEIISKKTKTTKWIKCYIKPDTISQTEFNGFTCIIEDITKHKNAALSRLQAEKKFATLFYKSTIPILLTDLETHKIVDASNTFLAKTGFSRKEIIGKTTLELNIYENNTERQRIVELFIKKEKIENLICQFKLKDGKKIITSLTSYRIKINNNSFYLTYIQDITEIKKAQESLENEQIRLQLALEAAKAGWWDLDLTTNKAFFSKKYWEILGYKEEETLAFEDPRKLIYLPSEYEHLKKVFNNALRNGITHYELELNLMHKKGYTVPVLSTAFIKRNKNGKPVSVSGLNLDLTSIKTIENKLHESQSRLALILSGANDGLWDLDIENQNFFYSDSYLEMIGYHKNEIDLNIHNWHKILHPNTAAETIDKLKHFWESNISQFEIEFSLAHKDGTPVPVLSRGTILRNSSGKAIRVAGTNVNLTKLKKIEEELIIEKNNYRKVSQLIEQSKFYIAIIDTNKNITWINNALEKAGGYALDAVKGNLFEKVYLGENSDMNLYNEGISTALTGKDFSTELQLYNKNGYTLWSRINFQSIKNESGEIGNLYISAEYIGVEKAIKLELQKSESRFKNLVDAMFDIVFSTNKEGKIVFLNKAWEEILGYDTHQSIGNELCEYMHPDDIPKMKQVQHSLYASKTPKINRILRFVTIKGKVCWIDVNINKILNTSGETIGLTGTLSDISEHRKNRYFYEILSNNVNDLICLHNIDGTYIYVSPSSKDITGYEPEELIGKNPYDFFVKDDIPRIKLLHDEMVKTNKNINLIYRFKKKDGTATWLETATKVFYDEYALEGRLVTSSKVIDERKRVENQIMEALNKEKQLNELKTRFINTISHEFRTPLAIITTSTELLQMFVEKNKIDADFFEALANIQGEVNELAKLLNDVLLLQKSDTSKMIIKSTKCKLSVLIQRIIDKVKKKQDELRNISVDISGEEVPFFTDEYYCDIIFSNIIGNALKYSVGQPPPIVQISYSVNSVTVSVKDFGIGIPDNEKKQIFSSFFRAKNAKSIQGTGLGLNIVKNFVEQMDGKIEFNSEEGKGSTFCITLPFERVRTKENIVTSKKNDTKVINNQ